MSASPLERDWINHNSHAIPDIITFYQAHKQFVNLVYEYKI